MDTPSSLLERLRRTSDPADWARFVQLYTPLLFHWAQRAGLQPADAADLVQEVLVLLFRKLPEFIYDRDRSFRGWLRTLTLNKWREMCRRGNPAAENIERIDLPSPNQMQIFEEAEYHHHLMQGALQILRDEFPALTWQAFQRYVVNNEPADQVAADLGLRVGTVYAAKSRVLRRLREELEGLRD